MAATAGSQDSGRELMTIFLKSSSGIFAPRARAFDYLFRIVVMKSVKSVQSV